MLFTPPKKAIGSSKQATRSEIFFSYLYIPRESGVHYAFGYIYMTSGCGKGVLDSNHLKNKITSIYKIKIVRGRYVEEPRMENASTYIPSTVVCNGGNFTRSIKVGSTSPSRPCSPLQIPMLKKEPRN